MLDRNNSKFALTILYYFLFFNFVLLIEQAKTKDLLSTCNIQSSHALRLTLDAFGGTLL